MTLVLAASASALALALTAAVWTRDASGIAPARGDRAPLTPELIAPADWYRAHLPGQEPVYYAPGHAVGPYWFDLALLEGRRDRFRFSRVLTTPDQLWQWYADPAGASHLVAASSVETVLGSAVETLHRVGDLSVVRRSRDTSLRLLGRDLVLWGARTDRDAYAPGQPLRLTLRAAATNPSIHPHMLVARLTDWRGRPVAEASHPAVPADAPSLTPFLHELELTPPANAPPGLHELEILLFRLPDWNTTPLLPWGSPEPSPLRIGPVLLTPPPDDRVDYPARARFGHQIELVGHRELAVGPDAIAVDLVWRALAPVDHDYTVFVHVLDPSGQLVAQHDGPPWNGGYPTSAWARGRPVVDRRLLRPPSSLPRGEYRLIAGLYRLDTMARLPAASDDGAPAGDAAVLATLRLPAPRP